jgi:uncharacterized protein (TIGR00251 family)
VGDGAAAPTAGTTTPPWTIERDGLLLTVRLTPRGGRDAVDAIERMADGRSVLKVRVRAAASEGEANAALLKLIAKTMGVAPRSVALIAGATSRIKRLRIAGAGPALAAMLEKACAIG